jgi:glycosyltransferase involved in cell wall biosynthesis
VRICIFSQNNPGVYSGGRYHALMLAEALAIAGHEVNYVTNALPVFFKDFERFAAHDKIKTTITPNFLVDLSGEDVDAVIVTPGRSDHPVYYNAARMAALWANAQLILINFESGNWFNSLAPQPRHLNEWDHWKRMVQQGGTVLSSAHESERWAREFYTEHSDTTRFAVWSPSINSAAADAAEDVLKEKRAVIISRLSDPHKGMQSILEILPDEMEGWTLTIISGTPEVNEGFLSDLREMARNRGITLDFSFRPDDLQKFRELKRARILIFPSLFEGYGYPPIEALYCNTEVVSYDLPVVKETCGDKPYYAPHGDRAALREALKTAILDPQAGERDHHTDIRELAHIESASKRLIDMLEQEIAPENRTTNLALAAASSAEAKSIKDRIPTPLRSFLAKQRVRLSRLRTPEGRNSYMKRVGIAGVNNRSTERRLSVSQSLVDEMGVVTIRGWRLGGDRADSLQAKIGNKLVVPGKLGMSRPDILKTYPQYKEGKAGFEISGRFVDEDLLNEPVEILFYRGEELIDRAGAIIEASPSNAINWLIKDDKSAAAAKGSTVVILADLDDVKVGIVEAYDIINIANACKASGLLTTLLVRGDEAELLPQKAYLNKYFDEVVLADASKPAQKPHHPSTLPAKLVAVEKALSDIQSQRILRGVIATSLDFAPALAMVQQGAYRMLHTHGEAVAVEELAQDTILVASEAEALSRSGTDQSSDTVLLPLHPSAFGEHQEPIYGQAEIVIPATGADAGREAALAFATSLAAEYPSLDANVRILGISGDTDEEPEQIGQLTVHQMGPAADNDVLYGNATVIVAPFFDELSDSAVFKLKRTLSEAGSFGRMIVGPERVVSLCPSNTTSIPVADQSALFDAAIAVIDQSAALMPLLDAAGVGNKKSDPTAAYREFSAVMNVQTLPRNIVSAMGADARVKAAVDGLVALNPDLQAQSAVRVMLGDDLATADAIIANLRRLKIDIDGFHSRRPASLAGLLQEDREITLPPSIDDVPFVLATLDQEQAEGWDRLVTRLGGRCISLIPAVRTSDQNALLDLHLQASGQVVKVYDTYVSAQWSRAKRAGTYRIVTDAFVLDAKTSHSALQLVDLLVASDPDTADAAKARLIAHNSDAKIIMAAPDGGITGGLGDQIIRLDPARAPWSDRFVGQVSQADGASDSLQLASLFAHWVAGKASDPQGGDV